MKRNTFIAGGFLVASAIVSGSAQADEFTLSACTIDGTLATIQIKIDNPPPNTQILLQDLWNKTVIGYTSENLASQSGFQRFAVNYRDTKQALGRFFNFENPILNLNGCAVSFLPY
jgi:hypothetical protein